MNRIAKVAVDLSLDREFDYLIPAALQPAVEIGSRVEVPFGSRNVTGFVVGFAEKSDLKELKPIEKVLGETSLITPVVMDLARWMSTYYLAPFETCVRSVLPAVVRRKSEGEKKQLTVSLIGKVDATSPSRSTHVQTNYFDSSVPVSYLSGGNLPHWRQDGTMYFVTFRLADSVPQEKLVQWRRERDEWLEENPEPKTTERTRDVASAFSADEWHEEYHRRFSAPFEKWLNSGTGSCIFSDAKNRQILEETMQAFDGERYRIDSYVIMPNHVHVLVAPRGDNTLSSIIQQWKSVSSHMIGKVDAAPPPRNVCERGGGAASTLCSAQQRNLWQKESFDHIVRSPESLSKFREYILNNPKNLPAGTFSVFCANAERGGGAASTFSANENLKLTAKQQSVVDVLKNSGALLLTELTERAGVSAATVKALEKKGMVLISSEAVYRDPHAGIHLLKTEPFDLMPQQAAALNQITAAMDEPEPPVILLHGVTGSGKTEVYLQAIARALEQGKGAIVLVPEIALTPQTVDRFRARFADAPEKIAVLHSSLSDGERYDEWHRIRAGEAKIVVGARSALFAPVENPGLIVVDEEHEPTYKQDEAPRYSARDTAVMRGRMEKCAVVLGSATPALESYANAKSGKYRYVDMPQRVDDRQMPLMQIVDMRIEAQREGKPHLFSRELVEAIRTRLNRAEQTMIFMNRRGFSSSLTCPDCGYTAECSQCSVGLTFHKARGRLVCHFCGDEIPVPEKCPACASLQFKYSGAGTEKIEEVVTALFPKARIQRMDSDTMRRKNAYRDVLGKFRTGKIDILVGTQMIAKGLDFPNVTLVGVVNPDHALHMADFRAGERVFQLLTQVAGRAGRGETAGEVIVQTYTPHHPAIQAAQRMDFAGFCDQEFSFRQELGYPPYTRLVCITFRGKDNLQTGGMAEKFFAGVEQCAGATVILSPAMPAPIARIRGEYRWQILLRAAHTKTLSTAIRAAFGMMKLPKTVKVTVDVDAVSLL
ncbi:MAG: primosomal protein N' [Kiritimatiellales bacterium]